MEERDIVQFSRRNRFPVVCCCCPVCGKADLQRRKMKELLTRLEEDNPFVKRSLLAALGNVHPRHLLDLKLRKDAPQTEP